MKTTVKTEHKGSVIAEPLPGGNVQLTIDCNGMWATVEMTQAQAGCVIWGLEKAAEAASIAQERAAA